MKISTLSIVIGNQACNAKCPFCVSRMTGFSEVRGKPIERERHLTVLDVQMAAKGQYVEPETMPNFENAVALAKLGGTTTVLLTGKGEPTLAPAEITRVLTALYGRGFPFVELQTNGLAFGRAFRDDCPESIECRARLQKWRGRGLNTIAISVVSTSDDENASVYHEDYPDLARTVDGLHALGFTVRLSVMMLKGLVDNPVRLHDVIEWCKKHRVEQLTVRPIRKPDDSMDAGVSDFVRERGITERQEGDIRLWVAFYGKLILSLSHGAAIYDVFGQNICLTDCLTVPEEADQIRTLIYYSNGMLKYHWQYPGAVLLGAVPA